MIGGSSSSWHGRDCAEELCKAIEECKQTWGNDRAYKDALYKLDQVEQELETLTASPGQREARRAQGPVMSGQEPKDRGERPSEAERG